MTLSDALSLLDGHARSQVCTLEPRDCAELAKAIRTAWAGNPGGCHWGLPHVWHTVGGVSVCAWCGAPPTVAPDANSDASACQHSWQRSDTGGDVCTRCGVTT